MNTRSSIAAERYSAGSWLPPWTVKEHRARYSFAAGHVAGLFVVDCACGSGDSSAIFAASGAAHVLGIDVDAEAVARARASHQHPHLAFRLGDGREIPAGDGTADVFVCLETIEHVKDDAGFLDEVWRILRPGGLLICSTPNREVTNPGSALEDAPWNHFHVREYSAADFERLLQRRFTIVGRYGQNPVNPVILKSSRLLARLFGTGIAVKFNQLLKCRWFLHDPGQVHAVQTSRREVEYFVWILRR